MKKYILSIDGGGIRGIIPAMVLAEIERKTGKPIASIFDFMAGTSTGGILALGLSKKNKAGNPQYTATDLVKLYQEHGATIFKASLLRKIWSWIRGPKYSHKNFDNILRNYFDEDTLGNTLSKTLITAYDVLNNKTLFFKNWQKEKQWDAIKLTDILRATTAAPTYFSPLSLKIDGIDRVLVDGGVFASDPAMCAYANCKALFPDDQLVLLSLGTAKMNTKISGVNAKNDGKICWIQPLLRLSLFAATGDAIQYQLKELMGDSYIKIQSYLTVASAEIDDASAQNMQNLVQEAQLMIEQNMEKINDFCRMLPK